MRRGKHRVSTGSLEILRSALRPLRFARAAEEGPDDVVEHNHPESEPCGRTCWLYGVPRRSSQ